MYTKLDLNLSVDDRKDKPFHCDKCGEDYDACYHWDREELDT